MRRAGLILSVLFLGCGGDDGGRATTTPTTTMPATTMTGLPTSDSSGGVTTDDTTAGPSTTTPPGTSTDPSTTADATTDSSDTTGTPAAATLYINFDGVDLAGGIEDATTDTTSIPELQGTWAPIDGGRAATILPGIEALFAPFAIDVTDTRPAAGPYTMAVVSATPTPINGAAGLGLSDCDNANENSIVVIFDDPAQAFATQAVVNIVGFQTGVSYGLDPVEGADTDIMTSLLAPDARTFTQACATETANAQCDAAAASCVAGEQSSFDEMVALFGEA